MCQYPLYSYPLSVSVTRAEAVCGMVSQPSACQVGGCTRLDGEMGALYMAESSPSFEKALGRFPTDPCESQEFAITPPRPHTHTPIPQERSSSALPGAGEALHFRNSDVKFQRLNTNRAQLTICFVHLKLS